MTTMYLHFQLPRRIPQRLATGNRKFIDNDAYRIRMRNHKPRRYDEATLPATSCQSPNESEPSSTKSQTTNSSFNLRFGRIGSRLVGSTANKTSSAAYTEEQEGRAISRRSNSGRNHGEIVETSTYIIFTDLSVGAEYTCASAHRGFGILHFRFHLCAVDSYHRTNRTTPVRICPGERVAGKSRHREVEPINSTTRRNDGNPNQKWGHVEIDLKAWIVEGENPPQNALLDRV
ncbi:hypothetical protein BDD12DRAFT_47213 [Trichophaea hybrida]|nr:hypothetical protein BDD12DRAFT_47213 [Trichophaea hybrida]